MIIGAAGFIGTELSLFLCKTGINVIACDLVDNVPSQLEKQSNFSFIKIKDYDLFCESITNIDCMVILAGKRPYNGFCINDYITNVQILDKYMKFAISKNIKNIIFASSKAVYSGKDFPWSEDDYCVPSSLYGASKLACEQLGLYYAQNNNISFKALRFAQVIGPGERKGYLINTLLDNARAKKPQVIFGTGEQRRHYIYIKDVCRSILCAAQNNAISGVFNIGMKQAISNLEMAECVNDVFENRGNIIHDYTQKMSMVDDAMQVKKAKKYLGFMVKYDLNKAFRDIKTDETKEINDSKINRTI